MSESSDWSSESYSGGRSNQRSSESVTSESKYYENTQYGKKSLKNKEEKSIKAGLKHLEEIIAFKINLSYKEVFKQAFREIIIKNEELITDIPNMSFLIQEFTEYFNNNNHSKLFQEEVMEILIKEKENQIKTSKSKLKYW